VAEGLNCAAKALVDAVQLGRGDQVLDVAAGDGNAAIWAAKAGALVTATDLAPKMVALGRARSAAEGLEIDWLEADMEELPFETAQFDCVLSSFGVMCATDPHRAAAELLRVTRPGGKVGLVNWAPGGWPDNLGRILRRHVPSPSNATDQIDWGRETQVRRMIGPCASLIEFVPGVIWTQRASVAEWWEEFSLNTPVIVAAKRNMPNKTYKAFEKDVFEWVYSASSGPNGEANFPSNYLIAVAKKGNVAGMEARNQAAVGPG